MYRKFKSIKTRGEITISPNNEFFISRNIKGESRMILLDNDFEEKKIFPYKEINNRIFTKDYFLISFKSGYTKFISIDLSSEILEIKKKLYFNYVEENDIYIYIKNKDIIYRFDKITRLLQEFSLDRNILLQSIINGKLILKKGSKPIILQYDKNITLLWQKDLGELLTYNHDGKEIVGTIYQIKQYKDSLIVVSDGGIIRLVLETGEVLWHTKGYTTSLEIVNDIGYASTNASLSKINLETGERSGYGWEYHRLPDIEWQGKNYSFFGAEGICHQGLLWFYSFSSGESFIIAINPHDGYYEWIHHVDTNEKVDSIKFHKDKMFLHDTGGTLHIYEKQ